MIGISLSPTERRLYTALPTDRFMPTQELMDCIYPDADKSAFNCIVKVLVWRMRRKGCTIVSRVGGLGGYRLGGRG